LKKLLVVGAGALAATAASLTLVSTGAAGAAPPDTSGQTFSEAQATLKSAGYDAVMSTMIGDKVARSECTVVRQQATMGTAFAGGGWPGKSSSPKVLLSLDCSKPPKSSSGSS
jgi:beta-lactam-binding protein with PASTA domain